MPEEWARRAAARLAAVPPEQQVELVAEAVEAAVGDLVMKYCPPVPPATIAEMAGYIRGSVRERLSLVNAELGPWSRRG